jgi:hypothetical protein
MAVAARHTHSPVNRVGEQQTVTELGIRVDAGSDIKSQTYDAFAALYYSMFADDRPTMKREDEIVLGSALAGLGDLAAKINRAKSSSGFDRLHTFR